MIASLPMYARPELDTAHNALWAGFRQQLLASEIPCPAQLSQHTDEQKVWLDPNLLLSQTCGMPYRLYLHDKVNLVGTPDYQLDSCPAGFYRSAMVIRKDDNRTTLIEFQDAIFTYNSRLSQSGYAAAYQHTQTENFWFSKGYQSGSHLESARAVANAQADIACLDAVSWRLISQYEPFADALAVCCWTEPSPGLPLICSKAIDAAPLFSAMQTSIHTLPDHHRKALGIQTLVRIPSSDYLAVTNPPQHPFPVSNAG